MNRAMAIEDLYVPNKWVPFGAALTFHCMLLAWNPTLVSENYMHPGPEVMQVRFEDKLPIMQVKKPAPVVAKPMEKKVVKKAHKAGLSLAQRHPKPLPMTRHAVAHAKPAPHPFVSKITMPKFIPHEDDEPIAASPAPGISAPSPHRMTQAAAPVRKLHSKTRGVRAQDISFELSDRGSLAGGAGPTIAIPVGEESGDTAVLPSAAVLHNAPKGASTIAGYRYQPGNGIGSGELAGKDRKGFAPGYHGAVHADEYVEGSLAGGSGRGKTTIGHGFEIGGPVGDRKVIKRKLPEYPDWAEEKGISALVKIYFTVRPDGTIRTTMRILRSSGYTELDTLAKEALMKWQFSPTSASSSEQEAWGVITFRFTLA